MPQPFNNAIMTNGGARLLTRAQAGEIKIELTRIATGSGIYTAAEKVLTALQARTELKERKNSYTISNIDVCSDHSVKVTALITNQDPVTKETLVNQGYYINEMGLYAKPAGESDDAEILYSVTVTAGENGDFMPPYNGYNPAQIIQDYFVTVGNAENVTLEVDSGAYATMGDIKTLEAKISELSGQLGGAGASGDTGFVEGIEADNVIDAINEVFQCGNEKKSKLVENLVAMGIEASTDETWESLLNKVLDMTDTSGDTVTADTLLSGYTAHNAAGEQITGTMPDRRATTVTAAAVTQDEEYTYLSLPEGEACYSGDSKVRALNSDLNSKSTYILQKNVTLSSVNGTDIYFDLPAEITDTTKWRAGLLFPFSVSLPYVGGGSDDGGEVTATFVGRKVRVQVPKFATNRASGVDDEFAWVSTNITIILVYVDE